MLHISIYTFFFIQIHTPIPHERTLEVASHCHVRLWFRRGHPEAASHRELQVQDSGQAEAPLFGGTFKPRFGTGIFYFYFCQDLGRDAYLDFKFVGLQTFVSKKHCSASCTEKGCRSLLCAKGRSRGVVLK